MARIKVPRKAHSIGPAYLVRAMRLSRTPFIQSHYRNVLTVAVILLAVCLLGLTSCISSDWRTASRESAGIAANPATNREAILQIYSADAWGWRGWFSVHTWIAVKPTDEMSYTVYEVVGWRQSRGLPVLRIEKDLPDRYWYGERPRLIKEFRGEGVDWLIVAVDQAARSYPWPETYTAFPGPNSNTFTAWIARQVPDLKLKLPFSAIGSGYADRELENKPREGKGSAPVSPSP